MATWQTRLSEPLLDRFPLPFTIKAVTFRPPNEPHQPVRALRLVGGLILDAGNILYDDTAWRR
ncbi:MAG: hypothetical protein ABSG53_23715, partial [Thermoguttaceae bacterium]